MCSLMATVLLADHNAADRENLRCHLEEEGLWVREATDGFDLIESLKERIPQLVVLDLELPGIGKVEICRRIKQYGDVPIVVNTALNDLPIKIQVLDLYAEGYFVKPSNPVEIMARVRHIMRDLYLLARTWGSAVRVDDNLTVDLTYHEALTPLGPQHLTPLECSLLEILLRNANRVVPTQVILERLWGDSYSCSQNLWEYVRRLRRKIGDESANPHYIVNEPGLGYRFVKCCEQTEKIRQLPSAAAWAI